VEPACLGAFYLLTHLGDAAGIYELDDEGAVLHKSFEVGAVDDGLDGLGQMGLEPDWSQLRLA